MNSKQTIKNKEAGFTLFIAVVISATLLLVSTGIIAVAVKEAFLTAANRHSQEAFYAADSGFECMLFWDLKNPGGVSAFSTSTDAGINRSISCNGQTLVTESDGDTNLTVYFPPNKYCAELTVLRRRPQAINGFTSTEIRSLGYNDCDSNNPRRVQRAIRLTY